MEGAVPASGAAIAWQSWLCCAARLTCRYLPSVHGGALRGYASRRHCTGHHHRVAGASCWPLNPCVLRAPRARWGTHPPSWVSPAPAADQAAALPSALTKRPQQLWFHSGGFHLAWHCLLCDGVTLLPCLHTIPWDPKQTLLRLRSTSPLTIGFLTKPKLLDKQVITIRLICTS